MTKNKAKGVSRPASPRKLAEWEAGNWHNAPPNKVKYYYCTSGIETLKNIAEKLSGKLTNDPTYNKYQASMTWRDLTLLNYNTTVPLEVNWYLENFNGCGLRVTTDGQNYGFHPKDTRPWIWIPAEMILPPIVFHLPKSVKKKIITPPPHNEFSKAIIDMFDAIDLNKDGFLSKEEIDKALGKSGFTGIYGAMVATLKKHLDDFEELSNDEWGIENDGVTKADVTAYDRLRLNNPNDPVIQKINKMYNYAKRKIKNINRIVINGTIDPLNVDQGMIGDCWFLAAIVGLGLTPRGKDKIKRMIHTLQYNRYNVKFPGISKSITVTEPTDGEIAIFSSAGNNGLWLSILEKSYGAAVNRDAYFFVTTSQYDAADGGGYLSKGIEIMTGNSVDSDELIDVFPHIIELNLLRNKLQIAFQNNKVVTTGIRGSLAFWRDIDYRDNGLIMGHAYTVMGYNNKTDIIRVRNPWGWGGPKWPKNWQIIRGVFEMDIPTFWEYFSDIAFEE